MIGSQIGNYRVTARLGEGGMGTVYRATDIMLDREVALKVLRPELARQAALVERFRAEAVALARLRHEHIAALYGLDRQGDDLVMVMEFVSGETLESHLETRGPMSWPEALPVLRGVLAALGHAHVRGVVHRDIKPANVMIDSDGTVKVMDFGIARLMGESRQTRAGVAIGTPSYMAPEQLRGEDVDGRTDLYAAGALLFELLTGRVAFQGDSDYSLMMQQLNDAPAPPSTLATGIPRAVDAAVARAMAKKPAQRFGTATDFSRALDAITPDTFSVEPLRDAAVQLAARAPRDWRMYAIAGSLVAAAAFGVAAIRTPMSASAIAPIIAADSVAIAAGTETAAASASAKPETPVVPSAAIGETNLPVRERAKPPQPTTPDVRPVAPSRAPSSPSPRAPESTPTPPPTPPPTRAPTTPVKQRAVAPPVVAPTAPIVALRVEEPAPTRESESRGAVTQRVQELAARCVTSIGANDASAANRLLRGDSEGLRTAISDGRIQSASGSSADVDVGDGRAEGRVSVRVTWRSSFGANKTSTVRLSAEVSRSGEGWRALGCLVESGGGVR